MGGYWSVMYMVPYLMKFIVANTVLVPPSFYTSNHVALNIKLRVINPMTAVFYSW